MHVYEIMRVCHSLAQTCGNMSFSVWHCEGVLFIWTCTSQLVLARHMSTCTVLSGQQALQAESPGGPGCMQNRTNLQMCVQMVGVQAHLTMLCFADGHDDSVVTAELQLVSWTKIVDVMKDGGVIKKILKDSSDYKTATAESTVKLRLASAL